MSSVAHLYLDSCLAPLAAHLERADVTDIFINRPGELWTETLGGQCDRHDAPELTNPLLMRLVRQVAAVSAQGISREHPILSAVLPSGERVQAIIPPATRGEIAIAVRKHVMGGMLLSDYAGAGAFAATRVRTFEGADPQHQLAPAEDRVPEDMLLQAVKDRRNILISGGTSSGKTTFLNALLQEVPSEERLILIEDSPELQCRHANHIGLLAARSKLGEADVTAEDLMIASLRMRPDRIMLGEIRGLEATTYLRAVNTGHPGSISTIHADSPRRAIDQLALLVLQSGMQLNWQDVVTYVTRSIDIIVQLRRIQGKRQVDEILVVPKV